MTKAPLGLQDVSAPSVAYNGLGFGPCLLDCASRATPPGWTGLPAFACLDRCRNWFANFRAADGEDVWKAGALGLANGPAFGLEKFSEPF